MRVSFNPRGTESCTKSILVGTSHGHVYEACESASGKERSVFELLFKLDASRHRAYLFVLKKKKRWKMWKMWKLRHF